MRRSPRVFIVLLFAFLAVPAAFGRVLSYAPYTNRAALPAFQFRDAGEFVLVEMPGTQFSAASWMEDAEVVAYDVQGAREPRVIFPPAGVSRGQISYAAYNKGAVLIQTTIDFEGKNPNHTAITLLGDTGGGAWKRVSDLDGASVSGYYLEDLGGTITRGLKGPVRPVTSTRYAFVVETQGGVWGVAANGTAKRLVPVESQMQRPTIIGNDANCSRILVQTPSRVVILDMETEAITELGQTSASPWFTEGWIAGTNRAYVLTTSNAGRTLNVFQQGSAPQWVRGPYDLGGTPPPYRDRYSFFAAPTHDYAGAWMVQRDFGKPTTLLRHRNAEGVKTFWSDVTGPQIEALHAGKSGDKVLIQVHRPRVQPERWFIDPALAIWKVGDPAPADYEELFLNETNQKGFIHLDVDAAAQGQPFVFDSGFSEPPVSRVSPPIAGGGDVVQEWGVVRSSFKQELVLPGVARLPGAFNSYWRTDVVIYNPTGAEQAVVVRYAPLDESAEVAAKTITLAAREIRVVKDVLKEWFGLETGGGSLHIEPSVGVNATGRTYTIAAQGTYGFSMPAVDAYTAAGARFPLSFAGAFPGSSFRTNILITAPKGLVAGARLQAYGVSGEIGSSGVTLSTVNTGVWQTNNVHSVLNLGSQTEGGLVVRPTHGFVIPAVVAIDNTTNDPTYFPPDLPAPVVRTIPVIGHVDGANNSKFRSDLYLLNLSDAPQAVVLEAKLWDRNDPPKQITFTLLPNEDRVIRDALPKLFGLTGFARLRYMSQSGDGAGVRVTSRTYNVRDDGGTLGCLIPPLNSFQSAGAGEALEILGVVGGEGFRTNVGLVELSPFGGAAGLVRVRIRIFDDHGVQIDSFGVSVPAAGGMQINDIFGARNLTAPKAVLIRIETETTGLVGAYATLNDNVTNDPSFLAANLAAQQ